MAGSEGDDDLIDLSRTGQIVGPPEDAEVERAIASVPGVASATLRRDPDSGRTRLRLRLRAGEDAEQATWSIAATLRERFGIALDPASIRPVTAGAPPEREVSEGIDGAGAVPADAVPADAVPADAVPEADADDGGEASEPDWTGPPPPPSSSVLGLTPPPAPQLSAAAEPGHDTVAPDDAGPAPTSQHGAAREPAGTGSAARAGGRATIHRLDIERGVREVQATVALLRGEQAAQGVARAVPTTRSILRAIAEATASALQQFMTAPLLIGIDRIEVEPTVDPAHVLVAVTILADRGEEQLLGVSLVRGDAERAVVRATLDALNRRVSPFLTAAPEGTAAAAG
ncbi:MAG: hypothetical protein R6U94_00125 [Nitriliruptoraceae bacterium]